MNKSGKMCGSDLLAHGLLAGGTSAS